MRAITLWRPWAWSIIHGPKRIENRPWKPWDSLIGERLVIHAGKHLDEDCTRYIAHTLGLPLLPPAAMEEGLIGSVLVTGYTTGLSPIPEGQEPWFFGPYGWLLKDPIAFRRPVPCKGKQGVWTVPPEFEELCR